MIITEIAEEYKFGAVVGTGSWGNVYKANKAGTDDFYAVKAISKSTISSHPDYLHHLKREIMALRSVDHRFMIRMQGVYEDDTTVYIVTDLLTEGDLLEHVVGNGKLSEEDAAKYIRSLLVALEYLHIHKLAHRDVKLENILITKNADNEPRVVLTDLGLACFSDKEDAGIDHACGSMGYVAPEVFRGTYGTKADIYGAGCVLYCMLSGRSAFSGDKIAELNRAGAVTFSIKYWKNVSEEAI
jgi:serine/threonine protein kinase